MKTNNTIKPRILVFGKVGQVGWELRRILPVMAEVSCVDFPEVDLADDGSIRSKIRQHAPNIIINAAAYTAVDKAETEKESAMKINGSAPGIMAEEAVKLGAILIHYSTDYVFDGTKTSPYIESDPPNPISVYGETKLAGELAIQKTGCDHLIFRLCWVYTNRGSNFMLTMMRLAQEREKLRVVRDQVGSPTWARLIAEATAFAAYKVWSVGNRSLYSSIYHVSCAGSTSWHGFAEAILALIPPDRKKCQQVEPITTPEYPLPARRPAYSTFSNEKFVETFNLRLPHWEEALKLVLDKAP